MKTQILTSEALEASLPKFTVIQNLNHVILIFQNLTGYIPDPIDVKALNTFTAKYVEFRIKTLCSPPFRTYVEFQAADSDLKSPSMDLLLFAKSYSFNPEKTKRITRKILTDSLPFLTVIEKLNLVVTIFDFITRDEQDFIRLKEIISGYVRFQEKLLRSH